MSSTKAPGRSGAWRGAAVTAASIVLALICGAILMIVSDPDVVSQFAYLFTAPALPLGASWAKVSSAYSALALGALGSPSALAATTAQAAPLILAGLGVGLGFRAGLFNIGAQGQAILGAIMSAWVGFTLHLPFGVHLLLAVLLGALGGAVWGGLVGFLKAKTGAHEVIVTIMLNYVAATLLVWLLTTPAFLRPGRQDPISPEIDPTAMYPILYQQLHVGFLLALLVAAATWWLIDRSTVGFAIRAVGANPHAARTAGMDVARTTIITMTLSGLLAGLAGTMSTLGPGANGVPTPLSIGIVGSVGFDAITVALLGRSKPLGIIFAGLLFGGLHVGGLSMQAMAGTPLTLTMVLQALIVLFVAAPGFVAQVLPFLRERRVEAAGGAA